MSELFVSFIVANYNYRDFLKECLSSLVQQDFDPDRFEIVVVDDGSNDGSDAVVKEFAEKSRNIKPIFIDNSGLEVAVNTGIKKAASSRVVRVDSDDSLPRNYLKTMEKAVQASPDFDFYYCREYYEFFADGGRKKTTLPPFDPNEIFERGDFLATGTIYQKKALEEIGLYPEAVKNCGLENYAVILALLKKGKKGLPVSGTYLNYRRHHVNMSIVKKRAIIDFGKKLLAEYGRPFRTNQYHPYGLVVEPEGINAQN